MIAHASVLIAASRAAVWQTLMRPETLLRIMPVTEVVAPWRLGQPFSWKFKMLDKSHEVRGEVLRLEPDQLLEYEYLDPYSAMKQQLDHRHRVTITLTDEGTGTRVALTQDNNPTPIALAHAEGGWRLALNNLRGAVEEAIQSPSL